MNIRFLTIILFSLLFLSCTKYPIEIEDALNKAGNNKKELRKVLRHYNKEEDSLKFRAACFLIQNMEWHSAGCRITKSDAKFTQAYQKTDSVFRTITDGLKLSEITSKEVSTVLGYKERITKSFFDSTFISSDIEIGNFSDLKNLSADFLISHINNAFHVKESSPYASKLSFNDFCNYILPYRSCDYPFFNNGEELNDMFSHYLGNPQAKSLKDKIRLYNAYVYRMKCLSGKCPVNDHIGIYDLFFNGKHDCVGITNHAVNILRANGIPSAVVFYAAHKEYTGRHYHCGILNEKGKWQFFGPESDIPGEFDFKNYNITNTFKRMYAAQQDSPYMLKNDGELLPALFNDPCIKEVTKQTKEVKKIHLPFGRNTNNKIAYLYVFQNNEEGLTPATWGTIDTNKQEVCFPNVLFNVLYFPVHLTPEGDSYFSSPFWISKDKKQPKGFCLHTTEEIMTSKERFGNIILTRKFPRKTSMIDIADHMVNGKFLASNDKDFKQSELLYTISMSPEPYLQEFTIKKPKAYRYYRYCAPKEYPATNISMLEFITSPHFKYKNTIKASDLPILHPNLPQVGDRIKLVTYPIEKMNKTSWLDGNMTVSSGTQKNITFSLAEPQVVTSIRYAPLNADNGIKKGHQYLLMYWENGWRLFQEQTAQAEYLSFSNVPMNKLYWLRDITDGKEELPFIFSDNKQLFIYHHIIK